MSKELKLVLREVHLHKDVNYYPIHNITIVYDDKAEIIVAGGIAYAPLFGNGYEHILAAVVATPEELAKNPDVRLIVVDKED